MFRFAIRSAALAGCLLSLGKPGHAQDDAPALFEQTCGACHGTAGEGVAGFAPGLDRPAFWQELGERAPDYLAGVLAAGLAGQIEADGETFIGVFMPTQLHLPEDDLLAIGDYVLATLGETGATLSSGALAAARAEPPSHADLLAMRPTGD